MKTIAIAAVFVMLTAPTWADEAERQIHDPASSNEPIVLSESEMDVVTAGVQWVLREGYLDTLHDLASTSASSSTSTRNTTSGVKLNQMWGYTFYD